MRIFRGGRSELMRLAGTGSSRNSAPSSPRSSASSARTRPLLLFRSAAAPRGARPCFVPSIVQCKCLEATYILGGVLGLLGVLRRRSVGRGRQIRRGLGDGSYVASRRTPRPRRRIVRRRRGPGDGWDRGKVGAAGRGSRARARDGIRRGTRKLRDVPSYKTPLSEERKSSKRAGTFQDGPAR